MNTFAYWKKRFDDNDLLDFSRTDEGLLWLKLRSIDRKALLAEFCAFATLRAGKRISAEYVWQSMASGTTIRSALDRFLKSCQMSQRRLVHGLSEPDGLIFQTRSIM